ncbi:MAG: hypothetical protein ACYTHJ_09995 [Planctomycetota bacterium]|jgi:hypothetical protein
MGESYKIAEPRQIRFVNGGAKQARLIDMCGGTRYIPYANSLLTVWGEYGR